MPVFRRKAPWGMHWRSDRYYYVLVTAVGLLTDTCLFPLFSVAIPGRLDELGYGPDVGSKTGYLNAVYAAGMVFSTFPFTWLGARTKQNRNLLLAALALMAAGVVLLLLGKTYATMLAARTLQGASASGVWIQGLALVADNVDQSWLGRAMGLSMIGYSIGTAIGLPLGGILSGALGWKGPSVFALSLIGLDFCLRLLVLEKHEISQWMPDSPETALDDEKPLEPPDTPSTAVDIVILPYVKDANDSKEALAQSERFEDAPLKVIPIEGTPQPQSPAQYNTRRAVLYILSHGGPLTGVAISWFNGFLDCGIYQTALVLRLYQRYSLDELHAGYVFFAVALPSALISPFAGWLCDRIGPRPLSLLCCAAFAPALLLLIIDQLPLPAFAVILCFSGVCSGLINTPVLVHLGYVASNSGGIVGSKAIPWGSITITCLLTVDVTVASHCYGAFNLAYSLAAIVGSVVVGQILQSAGTATGFKVQIGLTAGLALACVPMAAVYMRGPRSQRPEKIPVGVT